MAYDSLFSKTPPLFMDQYAPVMGGVDFVAGESDRITTSQVFFRQLINNGFKDSQGKNLKIPYLVVGGLGPFFEWYDNWKFEPRHIEYLASLVAPNGQRILPDSYLEQLKNTKLQVRIDAMPEGELAFPDEPIVRLTGPHYQVELVEAALLNIMTSNTGWATIASQFWLAAQRMDKEAVLFEFGSRRTPEFGGLGGSRASYLAGWGGTSNLYAGYTYGIPTVGTMAHAFVMVRESEAEAFATWAKNMPQLAVFLVDTYDSEEGIRNAIRTCKEHGIQLRGIRLDSGNTVELSEFARRELDAAGFPKATIMASDSLSVATIHDVYQIKKAPLDMFGVGGNYVNRRQDTEGIAAVMKVARAAGRDLMKYSNTPEKSTFPGVQDVIRFLKKAEDGSTRFAGDAIVPFGLDLGDGRLMRDIVSIPRYNHAGLRIFSGNEFYRPIVPVINEKGEHLLPEFKAQDAKAVLATARHRFFDSMSKLDPRHKQIMSPPLYVAGIEENLFDEQSKRVRRNAVERDRHRRFPAPLAPAA